MKLFNTLGRKLEVFEPLHKEEVKLYTCGPTVYDFAHIGNLRSFVFDDTLRRSLEALGYNVKHVMNITDVGHLASDADEGEDKLEKGAQRESKTVWEVADFYIKAFENDMRALNVLPPNGYHGSHQPYARATDFIDQQIEMIKLLLEKGFAYQTEQAIYFDVTRLNNYGMLTGQSLADKEVAAREEVVTDQNKRHPQDFALWFFKVGRFSRHSMAWKSPWGDGFPGWHLECSAIIHATLGEPIDIHTGGVDHIGTHHTNEIAQTKAAFGRDLSKYWLHNEHLLVDGAKMSKSKGNFYSLKDITSKGYDPLALRLLFLQSHYRSQTNFTWESLDAAAAHLDRLRAWADSSLQSVIQPISPTDTPKLIDAIESAISDDLNSAKALAQLNQYIDTNSPTKELLQKLDSFFGLELATREDISKPQKQIIMEREQARSVQDWEKADALRATLLEQGIEISDTPSGTVWTRIN